MLFFVGFTLIITNLPINKNIQFQTLSKNVALVRIILNYDRGKERCMNCFQDFKLYSQNCTFDRYRNHLIN